MADLGWFRSFGQRSRAPIPSPAQEDGNTGFGEHIQSQPSSPRRLRPAIHRVSSLLSLNIGPSSRDITRQTATPSPTSSAFHTGIAESTDSGSEDEACAPEKVMVRETDRTWHNPSLDQMVETLQVAMMTKRDALAAIPVQYNSYVLALIEGFARQRAALAAVREEAAELRSLREKELEQFRGMTEEWVILEERYRAETRRLELLLAKTRDGMEAVALARSNSIVDRGARKRFQAKVKRLSGLQDQQDDSTNIETPIKHATQHMNSSEATSSFRTLSALPCNQDAVLSQQLQQIQDSSGGVLRRRGKRGKQTHLRNTMAPDKGGSNIYIPSGLPVLDTNENRPYKQEGSLNFAQQFRSRKRFGSLSSSNSSGSTESAESASPQRRIHQYANGQAKDQTYLRFDSEQQGNGDETSIPQGQFEPLDLIDQGGRKYEQVSSEALLGSFTTKTQESQGRDDLKITKSFKAISAAKDKSPSSPSGQTPEMQQQRVRRFSFLAGDGDFLPVIPPTCVPRNQTSGPHGSSNATTSDNGCIDTRTLMEGSARTASFATCVSRSIAGRELELVTGEDTWQMKSTPPPASRSVSSNSVSTTVTAPGHDALTHSASTGSVVYVGSNKESEPSNNDDLMSNKTWLKHGEPLTPRRDCSDSRTTAATEGDREPPPSADHSRVRLPVVAGRDKDANKRDSRTDDMLVRTSGRVQSPVNKVPQWPLGSPGLSSFCTRQKPPSRTVSASTTASRSPSGTRSLEKNTPDSSGNTARIAAARAVAMGNQREVGKLTRAASSGSSAAGAT